MSIRSDITVNWSATPRIITVASPSVVLTIQDLNDTLRNIEATVPSAIQFDSLLKAGGKDDLGGGVRVGITLTLSNSQLAFAARAGPAYVQCTVSGGNLVAVDANGAAISAISPTAFTQVIVSQSTSAALLSAGASQAAAVWDELSSAHTTPGTKGKEVRDLAALIKLLLAR
jgi:hypothetical protein